MESSLATVKKFPPITQQMAIEIAKQVCAAPEHEFICHSRKPAHFCGYMVNLDELSWYIYVPWEDGLLALRSSRVVVISRWSGKILYDGSANDEG